MMGKAPINITWDIGVDAYGRRVTLIFERGYAGGKAGFTIKRAEADQRDVPESVALLTAENIHMMSAVLEDLPDV